MTDDRDLPTAPTIQTLTNRYLELLNEGLAARDAPGFAELRDLADHLHEGREVSVKVVDDTGRPEAYLRTRYTRGAFAPVEEGTQDPATRFVLSRPYLQDLFVRSEASEGERPPLGSQALLDQLRSLVG